MENNSKFMQFFGMFVVLPMCNPKKRLVSVYFYNFGWRDYGVANLASMLDIVKVMAFALQEGKIAVHCHAGLGRTGRFLVDVYLHQGGHVI